MVTFQGDHKIESGGLAGNLTESDALTLVLKLFIREAAVFHALAYGSLTPSLTLFNDKKKKKKQTGKQTTLPQKPPLWLCK